MLKRFVFLNSFSYSIESNKDIKSVMDTWTLQSGYPVITVKRINTTCIEIRQERFSLDPPDASK